MHDIERLAWDVETDFEFRVAGFQARDAAAGPVTERGGQHHRQRDRDVAETDDVNADDQAEQNREKGAELDHCVTADQFFVVAAPAAAGCT